MTDVIKCTECFFPECLEPFSKGMGVYLTPEEVDYIKNVIRKQQEYIEALETSVSALQKENQEPITEVGQL